MIVAPSILSADFADLNTSIKKIEAHVSWLHIDVMDGVFVPNLTIGAPVIKALRPHNKLFFDTHLMIINPLRYIDEFVEAGSDLITIHLEAESPIEQTLAHIRARGVKCGISIKPKTDISHLIPYLHLLDLVLVMSVEPGFGGQAFMPEALDKIKQLKTLREEKNLHYLIEVDGGINETTGAECKKAGADVLVAGNFIFNNSDPIDAIKQLS